MNPWFTLHTTLRLDALYYHTAQQHYEAAQQCEPQIEQAQALYATLIEQEQIINTSDPDLEREESGNELERIAIALENQRAELGGAYAPFLQHLAVTQITAATALEAHINGRATEFLTGRWPEDFDKLSLEAKWLFLPRILGSQIFDPGTQPFQSFAELVKYRNALVHYKGRQEEWHTAGGVPKSLQHLGLTSAAAQRALATTVAMITVLAQGLQQEVPHWLKHPTGNYFEANVQIHPPLGKHAKIKL